MIRLSTVAVAAAALLVAACAPMPPAVGYAPQQGMRAQSVELGFVEATREIRIGGARTGVGGASGAMVGSIAGSYAGGSWQANVAGSIVGAILGAMIGSAIEEGATSRPGVEVTVRLDNGGVVVVVQDAEPEALRPGDRVRVFSDGPSARVTR